jgi:hypothetical protein
VGMSAEVFEFVSHANLSVKVCIKKETKNEFTVFLLTLLWLTDIKCIVTVILEVEMSCYPYSE